ncbi:ATP synthase subunit I [Rhabdothermincola sediminis]|uniref:ATP synthase subunit I n=1 Tax=Rhabdothermincola sediminis TaxID=2751370 RepID=UPI001AA01555|nr:ATP synthase subunit I [Rhabdothermincola sediminis]
MTDALTTTLHGPAPEGQLVRDMLRRAAWAAPALIAVFGLIWGVPGALSTSYAIGLVCVNFVLAATAMTYSARVSVAMMGVAAMFGFLIRLAIIFAAVLLVRDAWWVELVPLGVTIIVTHLGLLFWEMKYVSASLAFPGLKPKTQEYTPT